MLTLELKLEQEMIPLLQYLFTVQAKNAASLEERSAHAELWLKTMVSCRDQVDEYIKNHTP